MLAFLNELERSYDIQGSGWKSRPFISEVTSNKSTGMNSVTHPVFCNTGFTDYGSHPEKSVFPLIFLSP